MAASNFFDSDGDDMERQMRSPLVPIGEDGNVAKRCAQLNTFFQGFDRPLDSSSEQTRQFQDNFKRDGMSWLKLLCENIFGEEKGLIWKEFDFRMSWLDLANDSEVGTDITHQLMELLHPMGPLMSYLVSLSSQKKVQQHWEQLRRGQEPDVAGHYIALPFSVLPIHTQRDWWLHWQNAVFGKPPQAMNRQASVTPIYANPIWCPVSLQQPFYTEGNTPTSKITSVLVTPFAYVMIRFSVFLWKHCEDYSPSSFEAKRDIVDTAKAWGSWGTRHTKSLLSKIKSVVKQDHQYDEPDLPPTLEVSHKLRTCSELLPGYATIFDLLQCHYIPAPGQPFLQQGTPLPYQKMAQSHPYHEVVFGQSCGGQRHRPLSQDPGTTMLVVLNEVWIRGTLDLWNLVNGPKLPAYRPKNNEIGIPITASVNEESATEDLKCRSILLGAPINAILRCVQFHEFLLSGSKVRTAGVQKSVLPPAAMRDFKGSAIQLIHLILGMASGTAGDRTIFSNSESPPIHQTLVMLATLITPFRITAARLPEISSISTASLCSGMVASPLASSGGGKPLATGEFPVPCLWWVSVPAGEAQPAQLNHPTLKFVRVFSFIIHYLQKVIDIDPELLDAVPLKPRNLNDLRYVRIFKKEIISIITNISPDAGLRAATDTAMGKGLTEYRNTSSNGRNDSLPSGLSVQPGSGLQFLIEAESVLCGSPFIGDWEVSLIDTVGTKPKLYERPQVQNIVKFFLPATTKTQNAVGRCYHMMRNTFHTAQHVASYKSGPLPLSYASTGLWRESREMLKSSVQQLFSKTGPKQQFHPETHAVYHEASSSLICDVIDVLHNKDFARYDTTCTSSVLLILHRLLAVALEVSVLVSHPHMNQHQAHPTMHFLPPETWQSAHSFKQHESKIARICLNLKHRKQRTLSVADASPVPPPLLDELLEMLKSLSPNVAHILLELEKTDQLGAGTRSTHSNISNDPSRLNYRSDYDSYQLNHKGRQKVLSVGAAFEFRDVVQRGNTWVDVNNKNSSWRYLCNKLPRDMRIQSFPYQRPPSSRELRWALRATRVADSFIYRILDGLTIEGYVEPLLDVRWVNGNTQQLLPPAVSASIEREHALKVLRGGPKKAFIKSEGEPDMEVDFEQSWITQEIHGRKGFPVVRCIFEPPSTRKLSVDYWLAVAAVVFVFLFLWYSWVLWLIVIAVVGSAILGCRVRPICPLIPK
eukprot:TRINITY_DN15378_c0_g2_i2.p1 TRINITY_DN15378_c0_g2~~TRINITY_DN15378_c0_g2_i2.p1  ORF type:complete len:1208 (+),score=177.02 TRINITY_DN15378_c0_g2_i2:58-3681(+)